MRIADDVMSGQSIKKATKRRVADAGRNLMRGLLAPGVRARKSIKRAPAKKGVTLAQRRRKRQTSTKREDRTGTLYRTPHSEQHHRQSRSGTSAHVLSGLGWTDIIPHTRIGRRLPGSRQHDAAHAGEGDTSQRGRSRLGRPRGK